MGNNLDSVNCEGNRGGYTSNYRVSSGFMLFDHPSTMIKLTITQSLFGPKARRHSGTNPSEMWDMPLPRLRGQL